MLKFITHRPLWLNILAGIVAGVLIFCIFILSLNWLTHHGRSKTVPSVMGKTFDDAKKQLHDGGFEVEIQDSIYVDTMAPLSVLKQVPEADETVKENRTVYLTINRILPPMVEMQNLVGYSFRNAEMVIRNMGLRMGDTSFKPNFARDNVLEQWYDGEKIAPGTKIRMGSKISLVLGNGVGADEFAVPDLFGMKFSVAKTLLESNGLIIGSVIISGSDTANEYIYKQEPSRYDDDKKIQHIRSGQEMNLWLQKERPIRDTSGAIQQP